MEKQKKKSGDIRGAIAALVSVLSFVSCGQDTYDLVTQVDGSTDTGTEQETDTEYIDGIDIGVDVIDIKVPAVGQEGTYPAGEPLLEIEFIVMNYSNSYDLPAETEIPWRIRFGPNEEEYVIDPFGSPIPPGSDITVLRTLSPNGLVVVPTAGVVHAFCIRTLLLFDVNPQNDELCLYYTVE